MDFKSSHTDAKPRRNTVLNLALAVCFSGLFFMVVGAVAAVTFFAGGGKTIVSNLSYLAAVSLYLGFVVIALVGVMFSFDGKEEKRHTPAQARIFHPRRTDL
jgi:hypothetical protein